MPPLVLTRYTLVHAKESGNEWQWGSHWSVTEPGRGHESWKGRFSHLAQGLDIYDEAKVIDCGDVRKT